MIDMISQIAPQIAGTETTAGQQTQDDSKFAEVLGTTIKADQHLCTESTETQTSEQKTTDGEKSAEEMVAEVMASMSSMVAYLAQDNATLPKTMVTDVAVQTASEGEVDTAVTGETTTKTADSMIGATESGAEAIVIAEPSVDSLAQSVASPLGEEMVSAGEGMDARAYATAFSTESAETKEPVMTVGGNSTDITATKDNAVATAAKVDVGSSELKSLRPDVEQQQKTTAQETQQPILETKLKDAVDASADTKIEVAAEPSREFTIKPQFVNPVKSDVSAFGNVEGSAVTEISSTDDANVGADTSGSQNAYQNAALITTDSLKQMNQAQTAKAASQTDESLRTQVIDQIVKEVRMIKLPQRTDLVVRLTPPELGSLRVQISQSENGLTAQIQTSGDQVKSLLQANLPALNQSFSDAGLKMDSVSVTSGASFGSLMQDNAQGSAHQQYSGQRRHYGGTQDSSGSQSLINLSIHSAAVDLNQGYSWLA